MAATILCATDLTHASERTVDLAIAAAQAFGASLQLVHVLDDVDALFPAEGSEAVDEARDKLRGVIAEQETFTRGRLDEQRDRCAASGIEVESKLGRGRPWRVIPELAEEIGAFVVVIGDHGASPQTVEHEGWTERIVGSTTDRVLRSASRPVFVATGRDPIPAGLRDAAWFVGTDFSDSAVAALAWAKRSVARGGGALHVANVITPAGGDEKSDAERNWRQVLRDQSKLEAQEKLSAYVEQHAPGADAHQVLSPHHPARALAEAAQFADADVLVVGTHGQSLFGRILVGSTAERCLRVATMPVLLVPGPRE